MIIVLSGPSGAGKSLTTDLAVDQLGCLRLVPCTTRPQRAHDRPGIDYTFISRDEFRFGIGTGRFADWDYLLENYYGYEQELQEFSAAPSSVIVAMVARMALRMRQKLDGGVFLVFLDGKDDVLDTRLRERTLTAGDMAMRRAHRNEEREHASLFDLVVPDAATMTEGQIAALISRILKRD